MPPLALAAISIALWSSLALLSTLVPRIPAFELVGLTLIIGSLPGLPRARSFTRDPRALALGVYGLFGYHFCLFMALRTAPAVEANLINYLWPVLIVAFSPPLRAHHYAGAALAFTGAALIATGGHFHFSIAPGLLLALAAAVIWSSYSVLTRRLRDLPSATVSQFCLLSGLLALATHAALEPTVIPTAREGAVIAALGIGPMGAAFYCWDAALKRGDPRVIGALSYLTPLLSTACLVLLGGKQFTSIAAVAMILIVAGAALGMLRRR